MTCLFLKHINIVTLHVVSRGGWCPGHRMSDVFLRMDSVQYLVWAHIRTHPVVQVVMKARVTDAELELLQETLVIHHIESRDDVKTFLSGWKKRTLNQLYFTFKV